MPSKPTLDPSRFMIAAALLLTACGDAGECQRSSDCPSYAPFCVTDQRLCVECFDSRDCRSGEQCVANQCMLETFPIDPIDAGADGADPDACVDCTAACSNDEDCPVDAPVCIVDSEGEGSCAALCGRDEDCDQGLCVEGSCTLCFGGADGTPGSECGCDGDCASGECEAGFCAGDCRRDGCPDGLVCAGTPAECVECEAGEAMVGEFCSCDDSCGTGLECIGGICERPCDYDETCGGLECSHELLTAPSCRTASDLCRWDAQRAMTETCACNGDCDFDAPICLGLLREGERTRVCSRPCGPEQPCGVGTRCCATADHFYCLSQSTADASGATCID